MLKTNDPQAWSQLIRLISEKVADSMLSELEHSQEPGLCDHSCNKDIKENYARNNLCKIQH